MTLEHYRLLQLTLCEWYQNAPAWVTSYLYTKLEPGWIGYLQLEVSKLSEHKG